MKNKIMVSLYLSDYEHIDVIKEVATNLLRELLTPLDFPSRDADALDRVFCTDSITLKTVLAKRQDVAKSISAAITDALLEIMYKNDTCMGYEIQHEQDPQIRPR